MLVSLVSFVDFGSSVSQFSLVRSIRVVVVRWCCLASVVGLGGGRAFRQLS
jgi:hypothetical protein